MRGIGHAIDVEQFAPAREPRARTARCACSRSAGPRAGRATTRCSTALERAVAQGLDARAGDPRPAADRRRARAPRRARGAVSRLARACASASGIEPPVPRARAARAARAGRTRSLSATQPRGSETLDKVVYEAGACGVPVIASNAALDEFLGGLPLELRFPPRDADGARRAPARPRRRPAGAAQARSAPSCAAASSPATRSSPGRTPSSRPCPADAGSKLLRGGDTSRPSRPAQRRRRATCAPHGRTSSPAAPPARSCGACSRSPRSRCSTPLGLALGLYIALVAAQPRLRRRDPLEPALGPGPGRVAAVPGPDHAARLLAGRALRDARAARRASAASPPRSCSSPRSRSPSASARATTSRRPG